MDPKIYFEKRRGRLDTCLGKQPYLCSSPCTIITSGPVIVKILKLARFRRPEMPGVPSTMSGKSKAQAEYSEINVVSDGHVISCFSPRLILRAAKIRRNCCGPLHRLPMAATLICHLRPYVLRLCGHLREMS